jgi:hypothetical protein
MRNPLPPVAVPGTHDLEVWRQPKVPDSGSSSFDALVEPAI